MHPKDLEILEKLKNGENNAFKELFDLYYMPLCVYSFKFSNSYPVSEDIVQELFVKIWDEKIFLKLNDVLWPYLYKAVKNNTLQYIKKNSKIYLTEIKDSILKSSEEPPFEFASVEEEKKKLYLHLEALPEKGKEIFTAIVFQNMKYKDVAEQLNISVNTVKTHYSRALKKLRKSLDVIIMLFLV